jgi:hypothetical protein
MMIGVESEKQTNGCWGFVMAGATCMYGHSYGDVNNYVEPDTSDDYVGDDELVFEFSPHDNNECVDCDGL